MIAGVDWGAGVWVAAIQERDGSTRVARYLDFKQLLDDPGLEKVVIDVPIGLADRSPRPCDTLARKRLGPRASSVFPAPIRAMLGAATYEEACDLRRRAEGVGCSKQLFAILHLITDVDRHMTPTLQERIREGHPELTFTMLNGAPLRHSKKTVEGRKERRLLLRQHFSDIPSRIRGISEIDINDAYAMLYSGLRWRAGIEDVVTDAANHDAKGLRMEMVT